MQKVAIRLDEKTAAKYGRRVLMPGTAEHAAYLRNRGIPAEQATAPVQEPEPKIEPGPEVTHVVGMAGSWKIDRDESFFAVGTGEDALKEALASAERGDAPPEAVQPDGNPPLADTLSEKNMPTLRQIAANHGISYGGLRKDDLVKALVDAGVS